MKHTYTARCINCHFLTEGKQYTLDSEKRYKFMKGDRSCFNFNLACYFCVWEENDDYEPEQLAKEVLGINRDETCFYWKDKPEMSLEAAEILQKRAADNKALAKSRFWTALSVIIAGLALIIQGLPYILKLFKIEL